MNDQENHWDIAVIGGAGHVGIPLSLVFADSGYRTLINDINEASIESLKNRSIPYMEDGAEALLAKSIANNTLGFSTKPESIQGIPYVVVTIGTPIDEFHNPQISVLTRCIDTLIPYLSDDCTLILRSTIAPGVTHMLDRYLKSQDCHCKLAFCPERVVQGKGIEEIKNLPQLVGATTAAAFDSAKALFEKITPRVVGMTPEEAEFGKLICNAYRYITFAATNQLYMMVESAGLDYGSLLEKMKTDYPRMESIPGAGFAAGPCLMKDTMQLFAKGKYKFPLGEVAMMINEGMPDFIVDRISKMYDLTKITVGILGMAFKSNSDDPRDSLSFKLKKQLLFSGAKVLFTDANFTPSGSVNLETVLHESDVIIIGVPHKEYKSLKFRDDVEVIDIWYSTNNPKDPKRLLEPLEI